MEANRATGQITRLGGYTEVTGVTNLARDGIDERQFRFGLRFSFWAGAESVRHLAYCLSDRGAAA